MINLKGIKEHIIVNVILVEEVKNKNFINDNI